MMSLFMVARILAMHKSEVIVPHIRPGGIMGVEAAKAPHQHVNASSLGVPIRTLFLILKVG